MSALTDDISRRHWRLGVGHPDIDVCLCGWKQHRDNGQIGYNRHLIEVTEAAVREQIGQELHKWGVLSDMHGAWSYAEVWWDAEAIATTTDAAPTPGTRLDRVNKVREEIASKIEQQAHSRDDLMRLVRDGTSTDWVAGWDAATLAAAEIARGEA